MSQCSLNIAPFRSVLFGAVLVLFSFTLTFLHVAVPSESAVGPFLQRLMFRSVLQSSLFWRQRAL